MSDAQIAMLKQCKDGLDGNSLPESGLATLFWLAEQKGLCQPEGGRISSTVFRLTPAGEALLSALDRYEQQQAEEQRKYDEQITQANKNVQKQIKHNWLIAIFTTIAGFITGLVCEYFFQILSFFFP